LTWSAISRRVQVMKLLVQFSPNAFLCTK
jgi:hypothetical protein